MSSSNPSESSVLCSRRNLLPQEWLHLGGFLSLKFDDLLGKMHDIPLEWIGRRDAELNERFKQWIPYALLLDEDEKLAVYPRQGTERRSHGLWSAGVGGHVHPQDGLTWQHALVNGLKREMKEEYGGNLLGAPEMLGLVNEELTSLGRVHIGVVFVQRCERGGSACSTELSGLEWVSLEGLSHFTSCNKFEKWSLLAMEILAGRTDDPRR